MKIFFDPTDHSYTSEYGKEYVPVTRICAITPRAVNYSVLPDKIRFGAAKKGTMLHEELQQFVLSGNVGLFPTTQWFAEEVFPKYDAWESEVLVYSDEEHTSYAGQIDLVCQDGDKYILWDLKTGGHGTVDYQLSLYKRAFCKMRNCDPDIVQLRCIDARIDSNIKIINVRTIAEHWLDNLLACYETGQRYKEPFLELTGIDSEHLQKLEAMESYISSLESQIKVLEEQRETFKTELYKAMESAQVESFTYGAIRATRVHPTTAESLDSKALKADNPELYEKYKKVSNRKGYLRITVQDLTEAQ